MMKKKTTVAKISVPRIDGTAMAAMVPLDGALAQTPSLDGPIELVDDARTEWVTVTGLAL
jgi:hypothetical protein